jgi:hypothetical protein
MDPSKNPPPALKGTKDKKGKKVNNKGEAPTITDDREQVSRLGPKVPGESADSAVPSFRHL